MSAVHGYVDSHCHLDDTRGETLDAVVDAARDAGVATMITIGCDVAGSRTMIGIAERFDGIWATAGVHPHDAKRGLDGLAELLGHPKLVAVGECGLDYHYDNSPREVQRTVFAEQLALAAAHDLPVVIHTREAWEDTFAILDEAGAGERCVFHCFSGGVDEARRALERGARLSFSGIVTFPAATEVHDAARHCPADRLLAETDSPYLTPVPHRGKPNRPAYVTHVVARLAELRGEAVGTVRDAVAANTARAFPRIAGGS